MVFMYVNIPYMDPMGDECSLQMLFLSSYFIRVHHNISTVIQLCIIVIVHRQNALV